MKNKEEDVYTKLGKSLIERRVTSTELPWIRVSIAVAREGNLASNMHGPKAVVHSPLHAGLAGFPSRALVRLTSLLSSRLRIRTVLSTLYSGNI
jgi:hypothetical protein